MKILAKICVAGALQLLCLATLLPAGAGAAQAPVWKLNASAQPTNLVPGSNDGKYFLVATNVGSKATSGSIVISDTLPEDIAVNTGGLGPRAGSNSPGAKGFGVFECGIAGRTVTCIGSGSIHPGSELEVVIPVEIAGSPQDIPHINESEVSGGGATGVQVSTPTTLSAAPASFGFLPGEAGFASPLLEEEGAPATAAGVHPYAMHVDLALPSVAPNGNLTSAGHLRNVRIDLPPGLLANPSATPVRCTEAQLTSQRPGCPDPSAIGTVSIDTIAIGEVQHQTVPLYNMVPTPGSPAVFGFDALGAGIFPHIVARLRTESDYGASGISRDVLARGLNPILSVSTELWGDPSAPEHNFVRGACTGDVVKPPCLVSAQPDSLLNFPTHCTIDPLRFEAFASSWEEPNPPFSDRKAAYESADLVGNPRSVSGCNQVEFEPTVSVQPTTNLTDSPSGLDVDLHQPQDTEIGHRSTGQLRDATVTLPSGMAVNPSQADGLGVCGPAQIGMLTQVGESPGHFSAEPSNCPDASRIGTIEVTSPLLAQYDDSERVLQRDPETGRAIPEPLHGSLFVAKPFENPFGSLLAVYLTVEDPKTGIYAKLAGKLEPDPVTGQLTTRFEENPQLPLDHVRIHLFNGPRASLVTPATCGTHTTTSDLTPWSAPEGADAHPESSFQTTAAPSGGACPTAESQLKNAPAFTAGTIGRQAGAYSPFVLKLSREDGSQRLTGIDTTLPPGLTGKLAGIAECSDAQIAQAAARSHPNEGILERQSPGCPLAAEVGVVNVGAGAGPTPFYTQGHAYLAGPYKGAPLSMAIITPAIAGPFDLGTVVVRAALYLDPTSARIHAVSDPFPTILDGIPLDLRSVALQVNRPNFILNPTSCDPMAITGSAISTLGAIATLTAPFQVGSCSNLAFKPKLAVKLIGGTRRSKNPALKATLTMPSGNANIAKTSVALPHSEFLDQSHIRTICTRVQFAEAGGNGAGCPPGSVYGRARALTPLLDQPLEGPVFLRANGGERDLPDLVAALHGQIDVDLVGYVDSVKGGIRTTFEGVPDAPVSRFVLEMQGGKKGLLENSTNLCKSTNRATALFEAQNGKVHDFNSVVKNSCRKAKTHKASGDRRR